MKAWAKSFSKFFSLISLYAPGAVVALKLPVRLLQRHS